MEQTRQTLKSFRDNSRLIRVKVGTVPVVAGTTASPLIFPKTGYVSRIFVNLRGVFNAGAATTIADRGPFNAVTSFNYRTNLISDLINVTGWGAHINSFLIEKAFASDSAGAGGTLSADNYAAGVAAGNNTWSLWWILPVCLSMGNNYMLGLQNLQAAEVQSQLGVVFGANTDFIQTIGAGTGFAATTNLHIYMEYFEPPDATVQQPPLVACRLLEDTTPILATGEQLYQLPRQGICHSVVQNIQANSARTDSIDEFRLKLQKVDTQIAMERQWLKLMNRLNYGITFPAGVYAHDFHHAMLSGGFDSDFRDAIDTEGATTIELGPVITSGTTLGTNASFIYSVRRTSQLLSL